MVARCGAILPRDHADQRLWGNLGMIGVAMKASPGKPEQIEMMQLALCGQRKSVKCELSRTILSERANYTIVHMTALWNPKGQSPM